MSRVFIRRQAFRIAKRLKCSSGKPFTENYTVRELLLKTAYGTAFKSFKQVKLHHINCWVIPSLSYDIPGNHALVVCDVAENTFIDADTISEYSQMAGSVVRKIVNPIHSFWRPTQPNARNWYTYNTKDEPTMFAISYITSDVVLKDSTKTEFYVEFIIDITLSFRGTAQNDITPTPTDYSIYDPHLLSHIAHRDDDNESDISLIEEVNNVSLSNKRLTRSSVSSSRSQSYRRT
jgi:hypothetical protein